MTKNFKFGLYEEATPEVEAAARADYEAARKRVRGRPVWEKLNPFCSYDMGMQSYFLEVARVELAKADPAVVELKASMGVQP